MLSLVCRGWAELVCAPALLADVQLEVHQPDEVVPALPPSAPGWCAGRRRT